MELSAFLSTVTPLPLLFAFFTIILFFQRTWILPYIRGRFLGTGKRIDECLGSIPLTPTSSPSPHTSVCKESEFPDSWWTGKDIWELERRSIFSKSWLYATHLSRFRKPGDYQSITLAGYPIFLILGKDGKLRAFHNVCRHRAYTVTKRESGSSLVLGCRYHGWSYNACGALVKAPHFDNVPGFDKSQNGLFEVQTRVSEYGFVFVNLQSGEDAAGESFGDLDVFVRSTIANSINLFGTSSTFAFSKLAWIGGKTLEGRFNWKFGLKSNFIIDSARLEQSLMTQKSSLLASFMTNLSNRFNANKEASFSDDFFLFPSTSFHAIKGTKYLYSVTLFPESEQRTLLRYDLFCWQSETVVGDPYAERISKLLCGQLDEKIRYLEGGFDLLLQDPGQSASHLSYLDPNQGDSGWSISSSAFSVVLDLATPKHKALSSIIFKLIPNWKRPKAPKYTPPCDSQGLPRNSCKQICYAETSILQVAMKAVIICPGCQ